MCHLNLETSEYKGCLIIIYNFNFHLNGDDAFFIFRNFTVERLRDYNLETFRIERLHHINLETLE